MEKTVCGKDKYFLNTVAHQYLEISKRKDQAKKMKEWTLKQRTGTTLL